MLGLLLLLVGCGIFAAKVVGLIEIKKGIVKALRGLAAFIEKRSEDLPPPPPIEEKREEEKTLRLASRICSQFKELRKLAKELSQDTYYDTPLRQKLSTLLETYTLDGCVFTEKDDSYHAGIESVLKNMFSNITSDMLLTQYRINQREVDYFIEAWERSIEFERQLDQYKQE